MSGLYKLLLVLMLVQVTVGGRRLCPDNSTRCITANTCCPMLYDDRYACCPFDHAVCCPDHIHCCPTGFKCDVKGARCTNSLTTLQWLLPRFFDSETVPSMPYTNGTLPIIGSVSLPVVADNTASSAARHSTLGPATHYAASVRPEVLGANMTACPDSSACLGQHSSCCLTVDGYGCCPYAQGVCCTDGLSCCPSSATCGSGITCVGIMDTLV